jgi:hypothetical protein
MLPIDRKFKCERQMQMQLKIDFFIRALLCLIILTVETCGKFITKRKFNILHRFSPESDSLLNATFIAFKKLNI